MAVNLYKLLKVSQTATVAEIRAAINAAEQAGRLDSSLLTAARQALLNPALRAKYDARLSASLMGDEQRQVAPPVTLQATPVAAAASVFCCACGKPMSIGDAFCASCGSQTGAPKTLLQNQERRSAFVKGSMINDEGVIYAARVSWLSQLGLYILAFFFLPLLFVYPKFPLSLFLIILAIINVKTVDLSLSSKRVIGKYGFIRRSSVDLPIGRIESINIRQGLFGRIFNYGVVEICGVGSNKVSIPNISEPLKFREAVMRYLDR